MNLTKIITLNAEKTGNYKTTNFFFVVYNLFCSLEFFVNYKIFVVWWGLTTNLFVVYKFFFVVYNFTQFMAESDKNHYLKWKCSINCHFKHSLWPSVTKIIILNANAKEIITSDKNHYFKCK